MSKHKDRLEIIALYAELVAAIGVIASVVYLGFQIANNTAALKTQAHDNVLRQASQPILLELQDPELNKIVHRGNTAPESLSDDEWNRYLLYQLLAINSWEYAYYLNKDGSTPPEIWVGMNAYYIEEATSLPGLKMFWGQYAYVYAEPFRSYADTYFQIPLHSANKQEK